MVARAWPIVLLIIVINLLLCLNYKLNFIVEKNFRHRVQCYLRTQASTRGLEMYPPWIRKDPTALPEFKITPSLCRVVCKCLTVL